MTTPYDEGQAIAFQADVRALYKEAKENYEIEDDAHVAWVSRMVYDAALLGYEDSRRIHLAELRRQLGLEHMDVPPLAGRLRVVGNRFFDRYGPYRWRNVTGFDALRLFVEGQFAQLDAYADWTHEVGAAGWRVFGNWSVTGFDYRKVKDYPVALAGLVEYLAENSLRLGFTALCDCNRLGITPDQQRLFLRDCAALLANHENATLEVANEPWNNGVDVLALASVLPRDTGLLMALGAGQDGMAYSPSIGYTTIHNRRTADWYRYVGKDLGIDVQNLTRDAVVADEPNKLEITGYTPSDWERAGYNAAMFTAGMTVHGNSLTMQRCVVPDGEEDDLVRRTLRAMSTVPLDAPTWSYARYGPAAPPTPMPVERDQDDDNQIRLYAKVGETEACALSLHHSYEDGWRPTGINGWHVVGQMGPFVLCRR